MVVKISRIIFLLSLIFSFTSYGQSIQKQYSAEDLFKGYALTTCIANGLHSGKGAEYAAAAAREYSEHGTFPMEAETKARLLGLTFLAKKYQNIYGENLVFIKCIDFYNSAELRDLMKKYPKVNQPSAGSWETT